ncbi:Type I phosphodiesterase / nucleotide pyrophosphatase [Planctomycetes bacterium Poly30]|uniref:Type I phosphodiesterase / nucleotide pyrophosphatase n=1 Tax=Saltatorellus ferox TaxID=2528018 RepID=A0A518EX27_9BACT|nr:Type I phosphodiesterase / nucleotide pyrophosphatase [Planctomycetes bacterium Poly30]
MKPFLRVLRSSLVLSTAAVLAGSTAPAGLVSGPDPGPSQPALARAADGRVLVVGFDGADWRKTSELMDAGELPNMAKLRDAGTAGPLVSTQPAESAAGWAAINTGTNPLKNGVSSFFKREFLGAEGPPIPAIGHVNQETVTREVSTGGGGGAAAGFVDRFGSGSSNVLLGVGVFFLATLVLRLVLKVHALLSLVLGVVLGGAAAFAVQKADARPSVGGGGSVEIAGVVSSQVRQDGFWIEAARAGQKSVALQAPLSLGRPGADGAQTLYGLGLPDVRASLNGDWFLYTTDSLETGREPKGNTKDSNSGTGTVFRVDYTKPKDGATGPPAIEAKIYGPVDLAKMGEAKARFDELTSMLEGDRSGMSFKESRDFYAEQAELERTLSEMGAPPPGSRVGPKEYKHRVTVPLRIVAKEGGEGPAWDVTIDGETQTLVPGAWSDFYSVTFDMGPTLSVHATTRARIADPTPEGFSVYVDTLQIDPRNAPSWQPASEPIGFAADLAKAIGSPFETLGWGCMTNQVKDKMIDPVMFLQDVEFTMTYRRKLMQRMLEEGDWRVLYSVFSTTDRVQHMMYRYYDPLHPQYQEKEAQKKVTFFGEEITLAEAIPAIYRQMDDIVGEVVAALKPDDTLILCADHGFTSYRRGMNVNNWLESEGYLVLKDDIASRDEGGGFQCVDWSRTRAYSLGLGMVYLNLEGRESEGIVKAANSQALMEEICASFLAAKDDGASVGSSAVVVRDLYQGAEEWGTREYPCADVMLGFAEFYRVSWSSTTGNISLRSEGEGDAARIVPGELYLNNTNPWSGDHASNDPNLVTGIFFCNRKVTSEDGTFSVMDIAPTVLDRVGAPLPAQLDRKPLSFQ